VFTTGLALAALASSQLDLPLDRIAAAIITIAVIRTGWELLRDAMRVLLDASLEPDALTSIRRVIESDSNVRELKWITGRNAGRFRFVEAGVTLRTGDAERAGIITERVERAVRSQVPHVERVLLHVESPARPAWRCAIPLADAGEGVSPHFGEAPDFAFLTLASDGCTVMERHVESNPYRNVPRAKGIRVAEWLIERKVDVAYSREDLQGKGPHYALRDAGIQLVCGDAATVDAAIAACQAATHCRQPSLSQSLGARRE